MSDIVLDASAVLAWIHFEPGAEVVADALTHQTCVISSVNLGEVVSKLAEKGADRESIEQTVASLHLEVVSFDQAAALDAGMLRPATRPWGLSLADRACLALATRLDVPVLTTDRAWANVPLPVSVTIARPAPASASPDDNDARP